MGYFIILPIPFDVLDAAVAEKLTYFGEDVIEYVRKPLTSVSTIYQLQQEQLENVGELRIRKLIEGKSELFVKDPDNPESRDYTDEEKEYISSKSSREEKILAIQEVNGRIDQEKDKLHERRVRHLHDVANGLLQRLKSDPFTWPAASPQVFVSLEQCLLDFSSYVKSEMRMSFWRSESKGHKWVPSPEQHAKNLLLTFLWARLGKSVLIFDEIRAGAGRVDIFVASPNDECAIVELKMCGNGYSLNYAQEGFTQIRHYMDNKEAKIGYLIIFDSRTRDFSKDIPENEITETSHIIAKAIDVRPSVK
jgi:hypothetical protein